ncbi:adenine-specific DNA-methyltransferase [Allofustis seminis]|uniref:adenine-specific DNA-methyltransferase n=1 Tax=Allofustis seminis TaxID=166939 RepID=UPI000369915B|nr:adenine-specific DNA-methyltransferase [Allofustis seminis]
MIELFKDTNFEYVESEDSLIIFNDCIATLKSIKDKSVNLIFADPPYNLGKDFGNDSDSWENKNEYLNWCYSWIDECFRVLKDNGTFYLMNSTQNIPYISIYIQNKYHIINDIVWVYDSSGVQSKKKYGSLYEPILMATKSDKTKYTFNHEDILVEAKTGAKRGLIDYRKTPPQPYNTQKVPGNVWEFPRVRFKMDEYENHPSQKPEALLERIIKASSNLGDVVLDPFGGSFSTGAVAVRLGRKIISMDINKEYFKIGIRRTGIATKYEGEILQKDKSRKTKNTSKKDHQQNQDGQMSLLIE